jgi:hypothetical protein
MLRDIMDTRYDICFSTCAPEPLEHLHTLADSYFEAYAIVPCSGAWKGQQEHAYTVTVVGTPLDEPDILSLAKAIKETYQQEAVLVCKYPVNALLI